MQKIIQLTKGKVCGVCDWPFNLEKSGIKLNVTIPYLVSFNNYKSSTEEERSKLTKRSNLGLFFHRRTIDPSTSIACFGNERGRATSTHSATFNETMQQLTLPLSGADGLFQLFYEDIH